MIRSNRYPSNFDIQRIVVNALEEFKNGASVALIIDNSRVIGSPITASEARRALGWMYGRGIAKVSEVSNGQERLIGEVSVIG